MNLDLPTMHSALLRQLAALALCGGLILGSATWLRGQTAIQLPELDDVVVAAFKQASNGWSSDEVLLNDDLNRAFLSACRQRLPDVTAVVFNWRLLTLRKQGKLKVPATRRRRDDHQAYTAAAEIIARRMEDRHEVGTDRIICDPSLRAEFIAESRTLVPHVEPYLMRKAALGLRKARQLKPELVTRVAEWDRRITVQPLTEVKAAVDNVTTAPGVYIFLSGEGYLYIGESHNLRVRIGQHLDQSNEAALINLFLRNDIPLDKVQIELHAFSSQSRAKEVRVRRAYESQLIDSRQPRFNLRP